MRLRLPTIISDYAVRQRRDDRRRGIYLINAHRGYIMRYYIHGNLNPDPLLEHVMRRAISSRLDVVKARDLLDHDGLPYVSYFHIHVAVLLHKLGIRGCNNVQ